MLFKDTKLDKIKTAVSIALQNQGITNSATLAKIRDTQFLAGGAIRDIVRGKEPKDFDLYSAFHPEDLESDLLKLGFVKSEIGTLYRGNVQFITCVIGTPKDVVNTFDFTVNQGYLNFSNEEYSVGDSGNELIYLPNCRKPMAALIRVAKFLREGYTISEEQLARIGASIIQLQEPFTYDQVKELFRTGSMTYKSGVEDLFPKVKANYEAMNRIIDSGGIPF